jgi:hypothetical protein
MRASFRVTYKLKLQCRVIWQRCSSRHYKELEIAVAGAMGQRLIGAVCRPDCGPRDVSGPEFKALCVERTSSLVLHAPRLESRYVLKYVHERDVEPSARHIEDDLMSASAFD